MDTIYIPLKVSLVGNKQQKKNMPYKVQVLTNKLWIFLEIWDYRRFKLGKDSRAAKGRVTGQEPSRESVVHMGHPITDHPNI